MKSFALVASLSLSLGLSVVLFAAQEPKSTSTSTIDVSEFNELLKASKWDDAATWVDTAIKENPDSPKLLSLSLLLANQTMRSQPDASAKRFSELIDKWCSAPTLTAESARNLYSATSMHSMMLMQKEQSAEAIEVAQRSLKVVTASGESMRSLRRDLESNLARILLRAAKSADALVLMRASLDSVKNGVLDGTDDLRELVKVTNTFSGLFDDANTDEVNDRNTYVENLLVQKLDAKSGLLSDLSAYVSFRTAQLAQLTYSDPARGIEIAKELQSRLDAFPTSNQAGDAKQLESFGKSLKSMLSRLESSMVRQRLVGTVAPEFEPQSFVGMNETTLAGLRGKVVLLDFWAVWCSPCIATFPHLRDWHDAYFDKGFVILGMTSDQGYIWDDAKSLAVRGTDVSHEQELEMLASFRKHHELKHGFVLTHKSSEYNKQLAVSGIPQAVLLDRQGVVRMIKVGSGPKNAHDLEEMIKQLLEEGATPSNGGSKKETATAGSSQ